MSVLRMGVLDVPYSNGKTTTGDVAEWLENKYGVMGFFWELNKLKISAELEQGISQAFESYLMGSPLGSDPFLAATAEIEQLFREFLSTKQMDHKVGGVPTKAAMKGVSSRFKSKRGNPRPSFIDTGMYETSFKAWMDW